jgi:hypothetical protein
VPRAKLASITDSARKGGLMIFAPSGSGKSRLLGRQIAYQDLTRGIGQVVFDAVGSTNANLLDKLRFQSPKKQEELAARIRYCNMAGERSRDGTLYVPAFPMLRPQLPNEPFDTTAERVADLFATVDAKLVDAPIQGLPRIQRLLIAVAGILTALRLPIAAADRMLTDPAFARDRLTDASHMPEASEFISDMELFLDSRLSERTRMEWVEPLANRLSYFRINEVARAMFSAPVPQFSWEEVAEEGLTVLIDLQGEVRPERVAKTLFLGLDLTFRLYIKARGGGGHALPPLSVVIDELTVFVLGPRLNTKQIPADFRELIQNRKRNANIWLTLATQEMAELPEEMLRATLQMQSHLYGATTEEATALRLAKRWIRLDPYFVNHVRNVWGSASTPGKGSTPLVLEEEPVYMSMQEQEYIAAQMFRTIPAGQVLSAISPGEGIWPKRLKPVWINRLDQGHFIDRPFVEAVRRYLMKRDGVATAAPALLPAPETSLSPPGITRRSPQLAPVPA